MQTVEVHTVDALLASYRQDQEFGRSDGWWSRHEYQAPADDATVYLWPITVKGEPGGPVEYGHRVAVSLGDLWVERQSNHPLPTVESVSETVDSLLQKIRSDGKDEASKLLDDLRHLSAERDQIADQIKATVVEAVTVGAKKLAVSDVTGVARSTIDRWLAEK